MTSGISGWISTNPIESRLSGVSTEIPIRDVCVSNGTWHVKVLLSFLVKWMMSSSNGSLKIDEVMAVTSILSVAMDLSKLIEIVPVP